MSEPIGFIRLPALIERTGLSKASIYVRVKDGRLPTPIKLNGGRAVGWPSSEITEIIRHVIAGHDENQIRELVLQQIVARLLT